jgi:ribosomal protein S27E
MQNAPEIKRENINRFLCENCGANMVFNPQNGLLTCPYCAHTQEIKAEGAVEEKDYEQALQAGAQNLQPMAQDAMQVGCDSCGAIVVFTPPETARTCDFCGAKIVAQPKSADPLIAPEGVLPFRLTDKQANENLKNWINTRWFAPSKLKDFARPDKLSSIYIPYWTYDAFSQTAYTGERGEHYYVTEHYEENGERKSRQVRHTRWHPAHGSVSRQFDDVCVPATRRLPKNYLDGLEPWDLHELKPYEPAYLSGHKAQTYEVTLLEGYEVFRQTAEGVIQTDVRRDIGGDEQRINYLSTQFSNITFKHLLLPVYAGAYRFNEKIFQIVVNGRTGEVQGDRPYSWIKITLFVLFIIAVIAVLVMIFKR